MAKKVLKRVEDGSGSLTYVENLQFGRLLRATPSSCSRISRINA
jgi:hypothetical protein